MGSWWWRWSATCTRWVNNKFKKNLRRRKWNERKTLVCGVKLCKICTIIRRARAMRKKTTTRRGHQPSWSQWHRTMRQEIRFVFLSRFAQLFNVKCNEPRQKEEAGTNVMFELDSKPPFIQRFLFVKKHSKLQKVKREKQSWNEIWHKPSILNELLRWDGDDVHVRWLQLCLAAAAPERGMAREWARKNFQFFLKLLALS